jgi:uncharacterized membrane protein YgdD (TMEM256/DUF423 family)
LALLILGLSADKLQFSLKVISRLFIAGVFFFSWSIYLLSIQELLSFNVRFLGPVTPIGGLLLIIGWAVFIYKLITSKKSEQ